MEKNNSEGSKNAKCELQLDLHEWRAILFKKDQQPEHQLPPVDYFIEAIHYHCKPENQHMTVQLHLELLVLKENIAPIKLLNQDERIHFQKTNKGHLGFHQQQYYLFAERTGHYHVDIQYSTKIQNQASLKQIELSPLSHASLTLELSKEDQYNISPSLSLKEEIKGKQKHITSYLKNTKTQITWGNLHQNTQKEAPKQVLNSLLHTYAETAIELTNTSITYHTALTAKIYQAPIQQLTCSISQGQIISITGKHIKRYDVSEKAGIQYATLYFDKELEGPHSFKFYYEQELSEMDNQLTLASLKVQDTEREEGFLAISSKSSSDLEIQQLEHIQLIDMNELPQNLKEGQKVKEALKYLTAPYQIQAERIQHQEIPMLASIINHAVYKTVLLKKGLMLTTLLLEIRSNNQPFIEIELPKETKVLSSFMKNSPIKPIKSGETTLMLSLPKFTAPNESFWAEITCLTQKQALQSKGKLDIKLPKINMTISHLYWELLLPENFKYQKFSGNIEKLPNFRSTPPMPSNYHSNPYGFDGEYFDSLEDSFQDDFDYATAGAIAGAPPEEAMLAAAPVEELEEVIDGFPNEFPSQFKKEVPIMQTSVPKKAMKPQRVAKSFAPSQSEPPSYSKRLSSKQSGKIPIKIDLPKTGIPSYFERLFIEEDCIELHFSYKKAKKEKVKPL